LTGYRGLNAKVSIVRSKRRAKNQRTKNQSIVTNPIGPIPPRRFAQSRFNEVGARAKPHPPKKSNERNQPKVFAKTLYKSRWRIVQGFGKLKRFKRVALRCDKTERSYRSIVSIAASLCLIKLVYTGKIHSPRDVF
jgi:hypothetical protein